MKTIKVIKVIWISTVVYGVLSVLFHKFFPNNLWYTGYLTGLIVGLLIAIMLDDN